mmetsp:Transcript_25662/g.65209  ORF Transcript_25662/g.65209 Transcript_25662/m.65209 type:complete len:202 (-) Transcript_25662:572-1177(-)
MLNGCRNTTITYTYQLLVVCSNSTNYYVVCASCTPDQLTCTNKRLGEWKRASRQIYLRYSGRGRAPRARRHRHGSCSLHPVVVYLRTPVEPKLVGCLLLLLSRGTPPGDDDETSDLVHDATPKRTTPLGERVEHALRYIDDSLNERLRQLLLACTNTVGKLDAKVHAVLVEDVVVLRGPMRLELCYLGLDLLGAHGGRPEV